MYVKRVLPNGVRIISERLDNVRTVSVGIWVGNGSRYEPAELNGISHFIEHMIFKGTEKRPKGQVARDVESRARKSAPRVISPSPSTRSAVRPTPSPTRNVPATI